MSEAEKGLLFVEFLGAANVVFANYMALVFAMLTASWLLAARMSRMIIALFLFLYTFAAFAVGSGVIGGFSDFFALQRYILETSAADGPLQWLGPVRAQDAPPEAAGNYLITAAVLLPWAGSMLFFFVVRAEKSRPKEQE